jgi:hypothetical protein
MEGRISLVQVPEHRLPGKVSMPTPPSITLRQPEPSAAELVISEDGRCQVYRLSLDQLRLLLVQAAGAISRWPVQ